MQIDDEQGEKLRDESGTTLRPCPDCGRDDELAIDSCGSMGLSQVRCDCGHVFQSRAYEENIGRHWNKHCKTKTPNAALTGAEGVRVEGTVMQRED